MHELTVLPMVTDKISFLLRVNPEHTEPLTGLFASYIKKGCTSHAGKAKNGYSFAYRYWLTGPSVKAMAGKPEGCILVQVNPLSSGTKYFARFEYNPSVLSQEGMAHLSAFFNELFTIMNTHNDYPDLCDRILVTRLDLAVDIDHAHIEDLLFYRPLSQKWQFFPVIRVEGKQHIQTVYLGSSLSGNHFCCYDKATELKKHKGIILPHNRSRVEARTKPMVLVSDLHTIKNPFASIKVFDARLLKEGNTNDWRSIQLLDSMKVRGIQGALKLIPPQSRKKYEKKLHQMGGAAFWKPDEIGQSLPDAISLEKLGLDCLAPVGVGS